MKNDPENEKPETDRGGPQGTQIFSREQLADILDEGSATEDDRELASLVLLTSHSNGAEAGTVFKLSGDRLTIGRASICDLCIDEPSMSSEHARLAYSEDAWRVMNLLSTNGLFVNDQKVFSHQLRDGDEIRLGRVRLRFRDPAGDASAQGRSRLPSWRRWVPWVVVVAAAAAAAVWLL